MFTEVWHMWFFAGTLTWYHTHRNTHQTQGPVDWYTHKNIYLHQRLCAHSSYFYYSEWIIHWYQKLTFHFIHLLKSYLLIRCYKIGFFLWNLKKTNFMAPFFYGWGSTASRLQPLRGGSLLFTTKFPEIPGTNFIDLGRMKGWVDLGATKWFWTRDPWIGNPAP